MGVKKVLAEVFDEISLSSNEENSLKKLAKEILLKIKSTGLKAFIGGSLAKGTLVKNSNIRDVDIFVVFKNETELSELGKILKKAGFDAKVIHGSRDYFHILVGEVLFEIIPVVKFKKISEANNVTDVSLTHVKYITGKIKKDNHLAREIKLAKAFCSANNVYGAESYIGGFSGYSLEVLVSYFGSFAKFLRGINKKRIIDPEKYFKNNNEIMRELNLSKLQSPVILIDPTYKYRNVCAGLHEETYKRFLKVVNLFLKNPSKDFFYKKDFNLSEFKKSAKLENADFLSFSLSTDRQEGDIAGTKMKKMVRIISEQLTFKNQEVLKKEFIYCGGKDAKAYFIVRFKDKLKVLGPPRFMDEQVKSFKKKHKNTFLEKKNIFAYEKFDRVKFFKNLKKIGNEVGVKFKLSK